MRGTDDTGVERAIATFESGDAPDLRHPVARGALARLRSEAATQRPGRLGIYTFITIIGITAISVGVPFGLIYAMRSFRLPPWGLVGIAPVFMGMIFAFVALSSVMMGRGLGAGVHLIVTALLRMGRCAACGYPIDAIPADGDGKLRCPECGAGWRDDRIGREAVPSLKRSLAVFARSSIVSSAMCRTRQRDDRGRLFQAISLTHFGSDKVRRGMKRASLGARPWIAALVATVVLCIACCIATLVYVKSVAVAISVGGIVVIGVVLVILLNTRVVQITRHRQLRSRICLACEQRLRREGDMLICTQCDGAWRRPKRAPR